MAKKRIDWKLFVIVSILIIWGLITLSTTSFPLSLENYNTPWHYLFHQIIMLGIGLFLALVFFFLPIEKIKKITPFLFLFNLFLMLLVFLPKIGLTIKGASRWVNFGFFSFQPAELLKITFILYLAAWLNGRLKQKKGFNELFLPFLIVLAALVLVLIMQPDMTTLAIIFIVGVMMYFFAPTPLWHTVSAAFSALALFSFFILSQSYRLERLTSFLNPSSDPLGKGYQAKQAAISLGSGKMFGLGLGMSRQKFGFLPESTTDSIFAIIGEEAGFLGCFLLLLLFLAFCYFGLIIAAKNKDSFKGFLALGITVWISLQALLNIAGIAGVLPLGGIPLPFFSYGGSHIISEIMAVGLLLNISKKT